MQEYQGACHCGAIQFSVKSEPIKEGLRCTCSLCVRKGAIMSPGTYTKEAFHIDDEEGLLAEYQFGSDVAHHYFCKRCGIYPFHQTKRKPGEYRFNLGCVDSIDSLGIEQSVFDGARLL